MAMVAISLPAGPIRSVPVIAISFCSTSIMPDAKSISAVRLLEGGRESVNSKLPAVITVVKEIHEPRYPSFIGIRKAAKATIPTWGVADLGLDADQVGPAEPDEIREFESSPKCL